MRGRPLTSTLPGTSTAQQESSHAAHRRGWQKAYATRLFFSDLLVIVIAVFGSQVLRFGVDSAQVIMGPAGEPLFGMRYDLASLVIVIAWMLSLDYQGTRDRRRIGAGFAEYRRVVRATVRVFGLLAIAAFIFQWQISRVYLLVALPTGLGMLIFSRWLWRRWLVRRRRAGRFLHRTVVVGDPIKTDHVAQQIRLGRQPSGFNVIDIVSRPFDGQLTPESADPVGTIIAVVRERAADTVVLTAADALTPRVMRELGWALADLEVDLVVAPGLTDVAGPRIHARPVADLPLIHVDYPRMEGRPAALKRAFDIVAASLALIVLSPVFLILAIAVRLDSSGPALFRQVRVGLNHRRFTMLKFRSMSTDAELRQDELLENSDGNGVLFKMRADPRVTRVGTVIRRFSLDELPQFINVLRGDMSLVGPRPPLPREVEQYDSWAHRRLLVSPGITGLWQVRGRSDLSWEDSIRLDLYYVENWSLATDIGILARTARAVLKGSGAY